MTRDSQQLASRLDRQIESGASPTVDGDEWRNTQAGIAEAFVTANVGRLRRVSQWGKWFQFDGHVWSEDRTTAVFSMVREHLKREAQRNARKERTGLGDASTVAAVERLAASYQQIAAVPEQFDADPWVINTPAGIVDLRTGKQRETRPGDYTTKQTASGLGGDCPRWLAFLADITDGDSVLAGFLQRVAGYSLTGSTQEHAVFFFYGTGGNGKSVFLNTLRAVWADYATVAPMETFTESRTDKHPTDVAMLRGARLVVVQETEEGRRWNESRLKTLTGGDPVQARFMRQDFFEFTPQFKLVIAGNHKPHLRNVDEAMKRRLHLVPFTVTVPTEQRDPELFEKLKEERPAILRWAIDGCRLYLRDGLSPPESVVKATADYFEAQDAFGAWLSECCDIGPTYWETAGRLFESWGKYCDANGFKAGNQKTLAGELERRGFEKAKKAGGVRAWDGLRIGFRRDDDEADGRSQSATF